MQKKKIKNRQAHFHPTFHMQSKRLAKNSFLPSSLNSMGTQTGREMRGTTHKKEGKEPSLDWQTEFYLNVTLSILH